MGSTKKKRPLSQNKQAVEICKLLEKNKYSTKRIAEMTGAKLGLVYDILLGKKYPNIAKKYNIDNYDTKTNDYDDVTYTTNQIHKACEMMEENRLSYTEISTTTGIPVETLRLMALEQAHTDITKYYNFTQFNKRYSREFKEATPPKRVRRAVPEETVHKICQLLEEGVMSMADISRTLKVSYTVPYSIKNYGSHRNISKHYDIENHPSHKETIFPTVHRRLTHAEVHEVCRLLSKGFNVTQVHENTRIARDIITRVQTRKAYCDISKDYEF